MNELAQMIDRIGRAEQAGDPVKALKILMGWTCSGCRQEFTPAPTEEPVLSVQLTAGLPILGPCCRVARRANPS